MLLPWQQPLASFADPLLIQNWPHWYWHQMLDIIVHLWSHNWESGNLCGENCATVTTNKNQRWQKFCLHWFMSKHVLKKDPRRCRQIWDAYYPPNTLGTTLCGLLLGGGLAQTADLCLVCCNRKSINSCHVAHKSVTYVSLTNNHLNHICKIGHQKTLIMLCLRVFGPPKLAPYHSVNVWV